MPMNIVVSLSRALRIEIEGGAKQRGFSGRRLGKVVEVLADLEDPSDLLSELRSLRSQSDSGVIHLNDQSIARFILNSPSPRPYSLIIFFDAAQLRSKPELHLPHLRSEFALVSVSYLAYNVESGSGSGPDKVFFCDLEFGESQHSFSLFGVSSLPHIRHVGPATKSPRNRGHDQSDFAGLAESMFGLR
ncbi:uncharacterized protein A4U43_C03F9760 [Asparagus officinalis]|uniref:Uncharacterized protein n=1 Tax=Asparagus officinalis TaxID=4686 RepID=A0A5P1FD09_ASPOF|nr:uncharacterized protein A4U43_C03F9760 [Asparagus officinalis]